MTPKNTYELDEIEKKNPFTVPEDYFANLNAEIMARLPEKQVHKAAKVSLWGKWSPWVYAAAMIAGVFVIVQVATKSPSGEEAMPALPAKAANVPDTYWSNVSISEEEFYQYLEDQLVDDGYYNYLYEALNHQANNM